MTPSFLSAVGSILPEVLVVRCSIEPFSRADKYF